MLSRRSIGALLSFTALVLGTQDVAGAAETASSGVVVVAVGNDAKQAALTLAREVYADSALLFPVTPLSDAWAQVLLGEAWPKDAAPSVIELAKVRQELGASDSDAAKRRLLASIGLELKAELVVSVHREGERAFARILRSKSAAYEALELDAIAEKDAKGEALYRFPDALPKLKGLLARSAQALEDTAPAASSAVTAALKSPPAPPSAAPPPLVPKRTAPAQSASKTPLNKSPAKPVPEPEPAWKSTWFWVALGGAAALGLTAFGIAKATESDGNTVHLGGTVSK